MLLNHFSSNAVEVDNGVYEGVIKKATPESQARCWLGITRGRADPQASPCPPEQRNKPALLPGRWAYKTSYEGRRCFMAQALSPHLRGSWHTRATDEGTRAPISSGQG